MSHSKVHRPSEPTAELGIRFESAVPLAAVAISPKLLTEIRNLYPYFPLDKVYHLILIDPPWLYLGDKFKPDYK